MEIDRSLLPPRHFVANKRSVLNARKRSIEFSPHPFDLIPMKAQINFRVIISMTQNSKRKKKETNLWWENDFHYIAKFTQIATKGNIKIHYKFSVKFSSVKKVEKKECQNFKQHFV